jgi:predicted AlkP superfamily phosphohydrolase/phosphomutase
MAGIAPHSRSPVLQGGFVSNKVLMIGLDGATFSLFDPLVEQGVMPFLGGVLRKAVRANLMSTPHPLTPQAWTSMITGRSPTAHGIYDFLRPTFLPDGGIFLKINDFRDNRCETIWSIANRHRQRATALNFYGMSPPPAIDGYLISGFVPWRHLKHATHPKQLYDEIRTLPELDYRDLGLNIAEEKKCVQGLPEDEQEPWIELQNVRDKSWSKLTCHLMKRDRTELTAVVLDGPDKVQHLFWRYVDPASEEKDPSERHKRLRELMIGFYRGLDRNIETMFEAAGPDTDILITSDHGFGPTAEIFYLNEWLSRKGYLHWSDAAKNDAAGQLTADKIKDHLGMVDWKRTLAFSPTPSSNAIFVKKDNGSGLGVKQEDYLPFVLRLQRELLELRDSRDGQPVVTGADLNKLRGSSFVEPCPDITLRLRDGGFVSILKSNDIVVQRPQPEGTHRPAGIFVGYGPSFRKGVRLSELSILDVGPLILTLLGIPVPSDMEGRVPTEAFVSKRNLRTGGATAAPATAPSDDRPEPSEEERQALISQLKILGYMD